MEYLGLNEIREKYLEFFEGKRHLRLKSYSLVPENDNSLLLINSGMAPMKAYFTGQEVPPSKRVTTCQKCIRTGDIENVGVTARHGTFFEMLGNFSFGDYFKEEIIPWSWEFLTEVMEIPEDRLYVSVYETDDEAYKIWNEEVGVSDSKIFRMGKEDNFWEHGIGPCGPCSEIYFDKGEKYGCDDPNCTVGCDCDRYIEVWNLVFTQYEKTDEGEYLDLANPNIDTGMGLERLAATMQDVNSIFDVDTVKQIREKVCEIAKVEYGADHRTDVSIRIITDHIRSICFMTADGVLPSNEGRGYVLRRLIRRSIVRGHLLGLEGPFICEVAKVVGQVSGKAYPELIEKSEYILKLLSTEEERFNDTIEQGLNLVRQYIQQIKKSEGNNVLVGREAFRLYDTYGFPLEILKEILAEEDIEVDEDSFQEEMEAQRKRAREAREESTYMGADGNIFGEIDPMVVTQFLGYDNELIEDAKILYLIRDNKIVETVTKDDEVFVVLDKTVMYAKSGGQEGDRGRIRTKNSVIEVSDCFKVGGNKFVHKGIVLEDEVHVNELARVSYDRKNRMDSARNHSATHLLQKALKEVLGNHVEQAGSFVAHDRMRFDFTHFSSISKRDLKHIEKLVNEKIFEALNVSIYETSIDRAKKMGALALFGEKYGDRVRVVNVDDYSIELCGGTHVDNTSMIGSFKIISENGVSAGVRRIEAITGRYVLKYLNEIEENINVIQSVVKATPDNIVQKMESFIERAKQLDRELEEMKEKMSGNILDDVLAVQDIVEGETLVAKKMVNMNVDALKSVGDKIKDKLKSVCVVLIGENSDGLSIVVMATDDLVKKGVHSGNIMREVSNVVDGRGGGRPTMAQGAGKDKTKIDEALLKSKEILIELLK